MELLLEARNRTGLCAVMDRYFHPDLKAAVADNHSGHNTLLQIKSTSAISEALKVNMYVLGMLEARGILLPSILKHCVQVCRLIEKRNLF